jgi:segregation and condensation protein A
MSDPYSITLAGFQGPMATLLDLVERRQLEIGTVSLSTVTEDFFAYLESLMKLPEAQAGEILFAISDFLVVASRLILIKSKWLLPDLSLTAEEEADIRDLEAHLALYKQIKPVMRAFRRAWSTRAPLFAREYFLSYRSARTGSITFYPSPQLSVETLHEMANRLLQATAVERHEVQEVRERVLSLDVAIKQIVERVSTVATTSFSNLTATRTRGDIVVLFLALLHLARDHGFALVQDAHFSDIVVHTSSSAAHGTHA